MDNWYNFYNLEALFCKFMLAGKTTIQSSNNTKPQDLNKKLTPVSIKNYLSDLRHFLGWLTFYFKNRPSLSINLTNLNDYQLIINLLTIDVIEEYKSYLIKNYIPIKTINRRLSTIRKFFSFCISQGWLKENPAKEVSNVLSSQICRKTLTQADLLSQFEKDLIKENVDRSTITSYLKDIQDLLQII